MLQAKDGGGAFAGLLFTLVGVWLQAEELNIIHIRLWQIWPVALVLFGGFLVWQGLGGRVPRARRLLTPPRFAPSFAPSDERASPPPRSSRMPTPS